MNDLIEMHARALRVSAAVVAQAGRTDLDRPTPCTGWDLRALLGHMIGQNHGFAAAVEGPADASAFADRAVGERPVEEYSASVDRVIGAFSAPGLLQQTPFIAVIRGGIHLPAATVVGFHLIDYVVHGWDVARTLGAAVEYPPDVLEVALGIAEGLPDLVRSVDPRAPFRPSVQTASTDRLDRLVANLGRDPQWQPGRSTNPRGDGLGE